MSRLSSWRARLSAVGLGLGLLVAVELGLRVAGVAGGASWSPPRLVQIVQGGAVAGEFQVQAGAHFVVEGDQVRTAPAFRAGTGQGFPLGGAMRDVRFSRAPSPGVERWAVLGGSAAMGLNPVGPRVRRTWPVERLANGASVLPEALAISGQLSQRLRAQGRQVQVINAGMIAQDSGGVRVIADELLDLGVDGLILYLGNNEGIGLAWAMRGLQLPSLQPVRGALRHLRTYRLLALGVGRLRPAPSAGVTLQGTGPEVLGQLSLAQWRAAGRPLLDSTGPTDDVYAALLARFEGNLRAVARACAARGVRLVVLPTPPHLGYPPFFGANDPGLSAAAAERQSESVLAADQALRQGRPAVELARRAVAQDPANAMGHFLLGQALGQGGDADAAIVEWERALDRDLSRKRSEPAFAQVAARVCAEEGCVSGDAHGALVERARAEGVQVYDRVLGDHEHLTADGNAWIAGLIEVLVRSG